MADKEDKLELNIKTDGTSFWQKIKDTAKKVGQTIVDIPAELVGGLAKGIEGVVDAGTAGLNAGSNLINNLEKKDQRVLANILKSVPITGAGWWLEKVKGNDQLLENSIKFNATEEWYKKHADKITQDSYMNDTLVEDIVNGVGQAAPTILSVAAAPFTAGASLSVLPYTIGGTVVSAVGQGTEEALLDGAEFGQALTYGSLQGLIEGSVEVVTAGAGKGLMAVGKPVVKKVISETGQTVIKKTAGIAVQEGVSEGIEEGLSSALNPVTKMTYQGEEALGAYKEEGFIKDVFRDFVVGAGVGAFSGEVGARTNKKLANRQPSPLAQELTEEAIQTMGKTAQVMFNIAKSDNISVKLDDVTQQTVNTASAGLDMVQDFAEPNTDLSINADEKTQMPAEEKIGLYKQLQQKWEETQNYVKQKLERREYKTKKGITQVFKQELQIPDDIKKDVYNNYLSVQDYIKYDLADKVPTSCLRNIDGISYDKFLVEKFGIEQVKKIDLDFLKKNNFNIEKINRAVTNAKDISVNEAI